MKKMYLRKLTAFTASLMLTAQSGIIVLGAGESGDNKSDDTASGVFTEDVSPYIKCPDITLEKGELKSLVTIPEFYAEYGFDNSYKFKCENRNIALLATDNAAGYSFVPDVEWTVYFEDAYVYGLSEGETTYTCTDSNGNLVGEGKITVKATEEINDPALETNGMKPVKVFALGSDDTSSMAYILYDNGLLCTFNNGTMRRYQKNVKDTAVNGSDIYTLSEDGIIYINCEAVNDPDEYTVVSANRRLTYFLCSDGCIRRISEGRAEKILDNIKSMDETFGSNHVISGIVETEDGDTSLIWTGPDDNLQSYILEEKFKPVRISYINPVKTGGVYFVFTADGKIYRIYAELPVKNIEGYSKLSETKVSVNVKLIAEDVVDMFHHDYITSDGKSYVTYGGKGDYNKEYNYYLDMLDYGNIDLREHDLEYLSTAYSRVTQYNILENTGEVLYSVRENDGTERYCFIKNAKPLTHVKQNYGIYSHEKNKCVLIQREDDALWKYVIETGELARVDADIDRSSYSAADVVSMARFLCGIDDGEKTVWMDINCDGVVNVLDFIRMKKDILQNF